jgi:hypothetical protein
MLLEIGIEGSSLAQHKGVFALDIFFFAKSFGSIVIFGVPEFTFHNSIFS